MRSERRAIHLVRDSLSGENRRATIVLLTSALCLAGWHLIGSYDAWVKLPSETNTFADDAKHTAAIASLIASVLLLGVIPLAIVKFVLRDPLADYGLRLGNLSFAAI